MKRMKAMLSDRISKADSIAIGGHVRPDGDCVGSCMGFYLYLKETCPGKQVDVYLRDVPDIYLFLQDSDKIRSQIDPSQTYDLFVSLDCADEERLDFSMPLFEQAKETFCIDHHISNDGFAKENVIDPDASSTSELLYRMLDPDLITREIAEALYLGIIQDTGVFQYSCTSPETMRVAADLMEMGIDAPEIIRTTFVEKSYRQNRILGEALLTSQLALADQVIYSVIRKEDMEQFDVTPKALDGIVSQLRNTRGVEVSVFLYELEPGEFKISLRSGGAVDVAKIATTLGGGGHVCAAGANAAGDPDIIVRGILDQIKGQLGSGA